MPNILITGGTGLIGTALSRMLLEKGYDVTLLSRKGKTTGEGSPRPGAASPSGSAGNGAAASFPAAGPPTGAAAPRTAHWNPRTQTIDAEAIRQADYIIHLAGAGVADKRWSKKRKKEIVESRTTSSALLVKALQETPNKVQAVVSISGIGWYGPDPAIPNPRPFEETDPPDEDFLGETCRLWEDAITPVTSMGKRLVILRTGIVLSREGGALKEFKKPVKMGVAAILGSGKQIVSWIHVEDLCRLFLQAVEHPDWKGIYNAAAPRPVDNKTLTLALASRLKGKYFVPIYVPAFLLKIIVGEMSIEVLKSTTVNTKKTRIGGFQFLYPSLESALEDLLPPNTGS
ncbi:MAG TPA: TIGR01777 family oxidoreductase [Puia sp.]|nr:TIGR01777 family oxidoreductase [Puia sp.]